MTNQPAASTHRPRRPALGSDLLRMTAKLFVGAIMGSIAASFGLLLFSGILGGIGAAGANAELVWAYEPAGGPGSPESTNDILVLNIDGVILNHPPRSDTVLPFSTGGNVVYGYALKDALERAAGDDTIKAVLLRVRTPGGAIAGSQAIADGIALMQAADKPVGVYIDAISASGGVWATANADGIFADHGSIIGSVGVIGPAIMEYKDPYALGGLFSGVETRDGITLHVTSAGQGKDLGNPFRAPTERELAQLDAIVDSIYKDFVAWVSTERGIDAKRLTDEFGAGVFGNADAENHGYIDGTLTYEETVVWLAAQAGLGDDYRLVAEPQASNGLFGLGLLARLTNRPAAHNEGNTNAQSDDHACSTLRGSVLAMSHLTWVSMCGG